MPHSRLSTTYALAAACCIGHVVIVIGTFLSWFRSGAVYRNSYETAALADHLALFDNTFLAVALQAWIVVPLVGAACVGMYALRLFRTAATFSGVLAILVGTAALVTAVQGAEMRGFIGVATAGPWTTAAGAITALICALGTAVSTTGRRRSTPIPRDR